jgi:hypothetical protein
MKDYSPNRAIADKRVLVSVPVRVMDLAYKLYGSGSKDYQ